MTSGDITLPADPIFALKVPGPDLPWTPARVRDYMLAFGGDDGELAEVFAIAICNVHADKETCRELISILLQRAHDGLDREANLREALRAALVEVARLRKMVPNGAV